MNTADKVATRFLGKRPQVRTAGEVRFIKDRGSDKNEWGWGTPGPMEREIGQNFEFKPAKLKPLAKTLRATLSALGFTLSAYNEFTRVKSAQVSPDGSLGGKGYIQKIPEMRRQFMNCGEALSSLADTLYDEINATHWNPSVKEQDPRERQQVQEIMEDVETIREDPEEWAEGEEAEMDSEPDAGSKPTKKASYSWADASAGRVAEEYLRRREHV